MTEEKAPQKMSDEEWQVELRRWRKEIISENHELFVMLGNRGKGREGK